MDIYELETYRLADAVKFNPQLNSRIWGSDEKMLPQVRERLLAMANDFREFLGIDDLDVKDITVSGSNAAYTYTPRSDIDLHLVVSMPSKLANEVYRELFDAKKYQYNDQHDFHIGPASVELYVQDADQPHHSQGIYSVQRDDWVQVPRRRRPDIDDMSVKSKYLDLGHRIDAAIRSGDADRMDAMMKKLRDMRQSGLDTTGEFGADNLAFKVLRANGTLDVLKQAQQEARSQELSLDERKTGKQATGSKSSKHSLSTYNPPHPSKLKKQAHNTKDTRNQAQRDYPMMFPPDRFKGKAVDHGAHKMGRVGRFTGKKAPGGPHGGWWYPGFKWFGKGMDDYDKAFESAEPQAPQRDMRHIFADFARVCADFLGIKNMPRMKFKKDPEWTRRNGTFGRFDPDTHTLELSIANRHPLDILRTMAHEMTHARQNEQATMPVDAGETGSPYEDEANAMAGRFMRHVAEHHPELFRELPLGEDFDPNGPPPGPETPPTMPAGTVRVDVSDVYDWYKLGQHISNLQGLGHHDFGKGPPSTILAFGSEPEEHKYIQDLERTGLTTTDIDPLDKNQPPGMKRQKTDPTYNVNEQTGGGIPAWRIRFRRFKDLSPLMPERENKVYLMPMDHSALRTFGNLTGKDDEKIRNMPTEAYLVSGDAMVGDMSIINAIHRELQTTKDQDRVEKLKKLYLNTRVPYSQYRPGVFKYPEILAEPSQLQKLDKSVSYDRDTGEIVLRDRTREDVYEASGYIPVNDEEARDPRYSMALTQDIRPGEPQRQAAKMGWKTDRAGRPPLLMPRVSAKSSHSTKKSLAEELVLEYGQETTAGTRRIEWSRDNPPPLDRLFQAFITTLNNNKNNQTPQEIVDTYNQRYGLRHSLADYKSFSRQNAYTAGEYSDAITAYVRRGLKPMKVNEVTQSATTLGGFKVKPLTIGQQQQVDELKLDAPQRRMSRDELQAYADRIKTGTKTKQDKFMPIIHGSNIRGIVKDDGTTEWDLDDLARQITTRPTQLLGTNAKMGKSKGEGEITYDLTLPALSGIVVDEDNGDFVEITTCPKAGECQLFCYARKGGYVMFPAASMSAAQALNFLVNDPQGYMSMVDSEVTKIKGKTGKVGVKLVVRWHDAGDFFSKEYLDLAYDIARKHPDVDFYAYTKVADVATGDKPKNFLINFSSGAKRSEQKKIELYKQAGNVSKEGVTVPKPLFRDLFVTDKKGKYVKDEKGRTQVRDQAAWDRFRNSLAQTYKIDPNSIITYDQFLEMPKGDEPRWNVVIFPSGHGDRAANRRDVINSFLLFH